MMDEAKKAMTRKDYRQAADYYTAVLEQPSQRFSREAQELLGLARERNGQLAHARTEYETYLRLYPEGEDADRVRQRLAVLLTATAAPQETLRDARPARVSRTELRGSFSQFYNRFDNFPDEGGRVLTRSVLSTDLDAALRHRGDGYDVAAVLNGGYDYDFLDDRDNIFRLNRLHLDWTDRRLGLSTRLGRQTRSTDGVLGRFDGIVLGYQPIRPVRVNALFGYPTNRARVDKFEGDKHFAGLSLDLGTFAERLNFNVYGIRQQAEGLLDREAVGLEARYVDSSRSAFVLVDYDVSYRELNTILAVTTWILKDRTTLNVVFDQRKTPILTTSNALIGQPERSLSHLRRTLSEAEVRDLARDRTATSRALTLGATRPLSERFQLSGDVTVSETTGTPESRGVPAMPATGYGYAASLQLMATSLIKNGDVEIVGLRYSNAGDVETIGADLSTRYPITEKWRLSPRIQADYRRLLREDDDEVRFRPALATDYSLTRWARFELEVGVDWTPRWFSRDAETLDSFLTVGYRLDF
jgi:hypothetical protein